MTDYKSSIAVIGGGAWGAAIASTLAKIGHDVGVLTRREDLASSLMQGHAPALAILLLQRQVMQALTLKEWSKMPMLSLLLCLFAQRWRRLRQLNLS